MTHNRVGPQVNPHIIMVKLSFVIQFKEKILDHPVNNTKNCFGKYILRLLALTHHLRIEANSYLSPKETYYYAFFGKQTSKSRYLKSVFLRDGSHRAITSSPPPPAPLSSWVCSRPFFDKIVSVSTQPLKRIFASSPT